MTCDHIALVACNLCAIYRVMATNDEYSPFYARQGPQCLSDVVGRTFNKTVRGTVYQVHKIMGDGHCGYSSLALALRGRVDLPTGDEVQEVKRQLAKHISDKSIDEWLTWGGEDALGTSSGEQLLFYKSTSYHNLQNVLLTDVCHINMVC